MEKSLTRRSLYVMLGSTLTALLILLTMMQALWTSSTLSELSSPLVLSLTILRQTSHGDTETKTTTLNSFWWIRNCLVDTFFKKMFFYSFHFSVITCLTVPKSKYILFFDNKLYFLLTEKIHIAKNWHGRHSNQKPIVSLMYFHLNVSPISYILYGWKVIHNNWENCTRN